MQFLWTLFMSPLDIVRKASEALRVVYSRSEHISVERSTLWRYSTFKVRRQFANRWWTLHYSCLRCILTTSLHEEKCLLLYAWYTGFIIPPHTVSNATSLTSPKAARVDLVSSNLQCASTLKRENHFFENAVNWPSALIEAVRSEKLNPNIQITFKI